MTVMTNTPDKALAVAISAGNEARHFALALRSAQNPAQVARYLEMAQDHAAQARDLARRWGGKVNVEAERAQKWAREAARIADPEGTAAAEALELHEATLDAAIERNDP